LPLHRAKKSPKPDPNPFGMMKILSLAVEEPQNLILGLKQAVSEDLMAFTGFYNHIGVDGRGIIYKGGVYPLKAYRTIHVFINVS
jgi:hypothetical protein